MLRRLHPDQPASFDFTPANRAWAEAQILKYPEGRQASAIIPLLFRAQEQEGWLSRRAIEHVADMLGMAYIRALEVATFYFMFQLQPTGSVAHVQVCGTLSCMIMGAEDLVHVCQKKISEHAHALSGDGKFSWEEVECLGACTNAPMAQIGKDYYEDLTPERLEWIIDEMAAGRTPVPGPQNGRYAAEPLKGLTSLADHESGRTQYNGTVQMAVDIGDTIKRIDGTEVPLTTPWVEKGARLTRAREEIAAAEAARGPVSGSDAAPVKEPIDKEAAKAAAQADETKVKDIPGPADAAPGGAPATAAPGQPVADHDTEDDADSGAALKPVAKPRPEKTAPADADEAPVALSTDTGVQPAALEGPRGGQGDNLKEIEGIGPVLEKLCHDLGIYHFDQIAAWTDAEIAWMDGNLKGFRGRVTRDRWVAQARLIGEIGLDAFRERAKTNDY